MIKSDKLKKIKHDCNGNPRYIFDYRFLLTEIELNRETPVLCYDRAVMRAKQLFGGKRHDTRQYGQNIVFTSFKAQDELDLINQFVSKLV